MSTYLYLRCEDHAPTPLDLDAIEAAIAACRTYNFGMYQADRLAHEHAPALVEEVKRLRAEVAMTARPAPAWDEDAAERAFTAAANAAANDETWAKASDHTKAWWRMVAQAAVRDHPPVKPHREAVRLAQHQALMPQAMSIFAAVGGTQADYDALLNTLADAALDLLPGRSEAEVKAEALREAADWLAGMDDGRDTGQHRAGRDIIARLRARADRIKKEK